MSNVLDFMVNGSNPSKVGGTGSTVKYFPRPLPGFAGAASAGPGGSLPTTPSSTSAVGALFLPAQNVYNGQQLSVLATGSFGSDTGDPSGTVTVKLYCVTGSLTSPTYTAIASTTGFTPTYAAAESWALTANLYGDSNSGTLGGEYSAYIQGALNNSTPKTSDAVITGLNFNTGNSALQQGTVCGFVIGVTFGTSDASNTASLFQFTIES
jgi:hypothetical protein